MINKIKSIIGGNPKEALYLKMKKTLDSNFAKSPFINKIKLNQIYEFPIVINNFNRLTYLKEQIIWLEKCGLKNIVIIDNQSTYIPLLNFYDTLNYKVIRCQKNMGYLSLWFNPFFKKIRNNFYVYTDSDIVGSSCCPKDFIEYFFSRLIDIPKIHKIGFGLNLEGIRNSINEKYLIKKNETKFWDFKYKDSDVFMAPIDTTFALYKPNTYGGYWLNAGRTDYPYLADHLPWFMSIDSEENLFYENNIISKNSFYQSRRNTEY